MKKIIIVLLMTASVVVNAKEKVKKDRDQIRLGYDKVNVEIIMGVDAYGNVTFTKFVHCEDKGKMKCKDQNIAYNETELDFEVNSEYTGAEKLAAQNLIDLGDDDIDAGVLNGNKTETIQFYDVVNNTSYYRTFTYTWITDSNNKTTSILDISEKF